MYEKKLMKNNKKKLYGKLMVCRRLGSSTRAMSGKAPFDFKGIKSNGVELGEMARYMEIHRGRYPETQGSNERQGERRSHCARQAVFPHGHAHRETCRSCSAGGDQVKIGTSLDSDEDGISANVHSSVSGKVVETGEGKNLKGESKTKDIVGLSRKDLL